MISQDAAAAEQEVGLLTFAVLFVTALVIPTRRARFHEGIPVKKIFLGLT